MIQAGISRQSGAPLYWRVTSNPTPAAIALLTLVPTQPSGRGRARVWQHRSAFARNQPQGRRIHRPARSRTLKKELPDFRTVERWAMGLLLEAGAIHKCDQHGWAKDRTDPHARDQALRTAREEPPAGLSPKEAVAAVRAVLESVGDTCPECD